MLRTVLLIAVIATTAGVYLEKRSERRGFPPSAADPQTADPANTAAPTPTPRETTTHDLSRRPLLPVEESGEPLSAMDRESLRDALTDWAPVPRDVLVATHDEEGMREVAFAAFRSRLLASARTRFGPTPTEMSTSDIELEDGTTLAMFEPRRTGTHLVGRSSRGTTLRIPFASISRLDPLPANEALETWRSATTRQVDRLLETNDLGERRRALELLLWLGDFQRAESVYSTWITAGGALALLDDWAEAGRTDSYRALAGALTTDSSIRPPVPDVVTAVRQKPTRSLEGLKAFLAAREGMRLLSDTARIARADECGEWTEWLARRAPHLPLNREEILRLEEELRLFRYDLLKSGGF